MQALCKFLVYLLAQDCVVYSRKEGSVRKFNLDPALCSLVQNRTCQDPGGSKRAFDTPRRGVGIVDFRNDTIAVFDELDGQKGALRLPNMVGFSWKTSLTH